jgi:hypothetical protein
VPLTLLLLQRTISTQAVVLESPLACSVLKAIVQSSKESNLLSGSRVIGSNSF